LRRPKRYTSPDGIDWRDPAMPVIRDYTFANGAKKTVVDPDWEMEWRKMCMQINTAPRWDKDPTYHSKKGRKNV
jgi:hypothetical protein